MCKKHFEAEFKRNSGPRLPQELFFFDGPQPFFLIVEEQIKAGGIPVRPVYQQNI